MRRFVRAYDKIPVGYGIAYRTFDADGNLCYPIPLNWIARWLRSAWVALQGPGRDTWIEKRELAAYQLGFDIGRRAGEIVGRQEERVELQKKFLARGEL